MKSRLTIKINELLVLLPHLAGELWYSELSKACDFLAHENMSDACSSNVAYQTSHSLLCEN